MNGVVLQDESCVGQTWQKGCASSGCCKSRAGVARWRLEQQCAERAFGLPQPQPARQAERQYWLSLGVQLMLAKVDACQQDQTPFSGQDGFVLPNSKAPGVWVGSQARTERSPGCRLPNAVFATMRLLLC